MKQLQQLILLFASVFFILIIISIIIKSSATTPDPYINHKVPYEEVAVVSATVYHATVNQCDSDPSRTSCMNKINLNHADKYRYVALSQDFFNGENQYQLNCGDTIEVQGTWTYDGLWIVSDSKNKRYKNHIDFLIANGQYCHKWDSCVVIKKYKQD